jgi:hypothetical protein
MSKGAIAFLFLLKLEFVAVSIKLRLLSFGLLPVLKNREI